MRSVPAGHVLRYDYIDLRKTHVCFEEYGGQYLPAIEKYVQVLSDLGQGAQLADAPFGEWEWGRSRFTVKDGRHRMIALQIAGFAIVLVCWLERVS
jgi:hypothetical protein